MTETQMLETHKAGAMRYGQRWIEACASVRHIMREAGVDVRMHAPLIAELSLAMCQASRLDVLATGCAMIELAGDDVTREEWRALYRLLDRGRRGVLVPLSPFGVWGARVPPTTGESATSDG